MPVRRMNVDGRTTSEQLYIPTLLVVGACEALLARCHHAARTMGVAIKVCELEQAAVTIPQRHPLAIVIPNTGFDTAAHELSALARDVRSALLPVDPQVSVRELEAMIAGAIDGSLSQRERRGGAGRYSIVDGIEEEAPFSRRTLPPPSSRGPRSSSSPGVASTRPSSVGDARAVPRARDGVSTDPYASAPQRVLTPASGQSAAASVPQRTSGGAIAALRGVFSSR